jgi:hypothetical protein
MSKLLMVAAVLVLPGCATIVGGGSNQPVRIESGPASASYVVKSSSGLQMGAGRTPSSVRLPRKNEYNIEITLDGYQPQTVVLTRGTNGWIWGNLLVGWIVGFIVDFATGSAYKLEPALVTVNLARADNDVYAVIKIFADDDRLLHERKVKLTPIQ